METSPNTAKLTAGTKYDFAALIIDTHDANNIKYFATTTMNKGAYDPTDPTYSEPNVASFNRRRA